MSAIGLENLTGMLAFVRAAEARSFTSAARQLGISPSGVSKAISRSGSGFPGAFAAADLAQCDHDSGRGRVL